MQEVAEDLVYELFGETRSETLRELGKFYIRRMNMARGVKKTLQEKIAQKEELIDALSTRVKKERDELNELLEMQKMEELNELRMVVQKSGMEISDIIQMAQMQAAQ